jgi:hypothetical protein
MKTVLAIALRLFLLTTLIVDGTLASAHSHFAMPIASQATLAETASDPMPCHDVASDDATLDAAPTVVAQHPCCDSDCACDFLLTAVVSSVAWLLAETPSQSTTPIFSIGEVLTLNSPRLLRPPIA